MGSDHTSGAGHQFRPGVGVNKLSGEMFDYAQAYIALSRIRTMEGVLLNTMITAVNMSCTVAQQ